MASAVYDNAALHFGIGEINWTTAQTDILSCLLKTTGTPTKTDAHWSDIGSDELADATGGYTQCTKSIEIKTPNLVSNVAYFGVVSNTAWTAATFTTRWQAACHGAAKTATNPMIVYHDFGSDQAVVSGTLTLDWSGTENTTDSKVFTITITAEA